VTITAEAPPLTALTDAELAAMYGPDDTVNAAILAEAQRRDDTGKRRQARRQDPAACAWEEAARAQYAQAERECAGNLIARDAPPWLTDEFSLWRYGNDRYATEELTRWFLDHPRLTMTRYQQQLQASQEAYAHELDSDAVSAVRLDASPDASRAEDHHDGAGNLVSRVAAGPEAGSSSSSDGPVRNLGHVRPGGAVTAELDVTVPAANGAATLDAARQWLARFVEWPDEHSLNIATVWAAGAHCVDREHVLVHAAFPRLIFTGAMASGKTHAMEMLLGLCPRPDLTSNITAPALAKQVAAEHSTIAVDEIDLIVGGGAGASDLRNLLNSGYKRSGCYRRANARLPVFGALMLAGLTSVLRGNDNLSTLRSRSVIIDMEPAQAGSVERYRSRLHDGGAAAIAAALASWGEINASDVGDAWPDIPDDLINRSEEIAEPLLSVAEVAGGVWPERIRAAVRALLLGAHDDVPQLAPAERILADVRACWVGSQMRSAVLAERLSWMRGGPWQAIFPDPARAGIELAKYLVPHGISPVKIWLADEQRSVQGYRLAQFEALWNATAGPEVDQVADLHSSGNGLPAEREPCTASELAAGAVTCDLAG
jgi:hypothetical protein